jgi:hypothetical protein
MTKTKKQFIVSLSFVVILIGISFWITSIQQKNQEKNAKVYYLNETTSSIEKNEEPSIFSLLRRIAGFEKEMSYLLLFQNNLEIRPTGGFVSSFATSKIKNAHPGNFQFYCTAVFDINLSTPTQIEPPLPIKKYLWVKNWQFRDGNWSPDFPTSAKKMMELYHLQGGQEEFDGVIAITPEVLKSLLEIHGPIYLEEYDLTVDKDNFLLTLEKQIEIDYPDQGLQKHERKDILKDLAKILIEKTLSLNPLKSLKLISLAQKHLNQKDILLYFKDAQLQKDISRLGWSGKIQNTDSDYLAIIDANVNAFKADLFVKRSFKYEIELSKIRPRAKLIINYEHTAKEKSWLTRDYQSWLRVYVPENSWFTNIDGLATLPEYGKEFGKTFVAGLIKVPINSSKSIVLEYNLPENFDVNNYKLYIQKQPGIKELPIEIKITMPNGKIKHIEEILLTDKIFSID